jgi:hypothetical protein
MAGKNLIVQFNGYPENDLDICDENVAGQASGSSEQGHFTATRFVLLGFGSRGIFVNKNFYVIFKHNCKGFGV